MLRTAAWILLLLGTTNLATPAATAAPVAPEPHRGISDVIPAQGWRERCRQLRYEIQELEGRFGYAPPWERPRLERRLEQRRYEFRRDCRY